MYRPYGICDIFVYYFTSDQRLPCRANDIHQQPDNLQHAAFTYLLHKFGHNVA